MIIFSLIILLAYSIVFILFRVSWKNLKKNFSSLNVSTSIIIAARNEEENILNLLKDISAQNYPKRNIETILVDDGSSDKTVQILKENKSKFDFKLYQLSDGNKGKKQAIQEGVKHAKGKILLFIDADCRLNKNWAIEMVSIFNDKSVSMVSGPVMFIENNILDKIQNLEFLSLIGTGAASIGLQRPLFCNGANLAIRKTVFEKNKNKIRNEISSGDDVFLLHSVKKKSKKSIRFMKSFEAIVFTQPKKNINDFINQRKRWTKKSIFYTDKDTIFLGFLILLMHLNLIVLVFNSIIFSEFLTLVFIFTFKFIIDLFFLYEILKFFKKKNLIKYLFFVEILYCFYIPYIIIISLFTKFEWKGRSLSK